MLQILSNFFGAIKEVFGFANKRTDLKNAPDVRAAAIGQAEAKAEDQIEKEIAAKNIIQLRKDLAE